MSEELKPCYRCGLGSIDLYEEHCCDCCGNHGFVIVCSNCSARVDHCESRNEAIKEWNSRPIEDALEAKLAIAVEALEAIRDDWGYNSEEFAISALAKIRS